MEDRAEKGAAAMLFTIYERARKTREHYITTEEIDMLGQELMQAALRRAGTDDNGVPYASWDYLLQCARAMLSAHENITPGVSRRDAEENALRHLRAAVDAFPHPAAQAR